MSGGRMMKSIEKLRELAGYIYTNNMQIIGHLDAIGRLMLRSEWLDLWHEAFDAACDEIEREIAERTCKMETDYDEIEVIASSPEDTWAYKCSACCWSFRYDRGIRPNHCPICGAKVVDE